MLTYASILEKPKYDERGFQLATGEIVEAACAALRHCAAIRSAAPAGRTCATCNAVLADGPQPLAAYEKQSSQAGAEAVREALADAMAHRFPALPYSQYTVADFILTFFAPSSLTSPPAVPGVERDVTDEMVAAAMRAFELMSSVLRYREKDKWHSCDIMGMRDAIRAVLALRPQADADAKLADLIKEYARDLRRNSSGSDEYPWEFAKSIADYLEILISRASAMKVGA